MSNILSSQNQKSQTNPKEKSFYKLFKRNVPEGWFIRRVEDIYAGFPDILLSTPSGIIQQLELKVVTGAGKVKLSPNQVVYLTKMGSLNAPVYCLVRFIDNKTLRESDWRLFHGSKAVSLKLHGLTKTEPDLLIADKNYAKLFDFLSRDT